MAENKKFWWIAGICLLVAVVYFVLPVDVIPDLIAGIGQLDDLVIGLLGLAGITMNVLWALGVLPAPGQEYAEEQYAGDGYYDSAYGEYREM